MNTTQIEFWVGITCTVILPLLAFLIFLLMDKLNQIKNLVHNLVTSNNEKDARINLLTDELTSARNRVAELEAVVAASSTEQVAIDEIHNLLVGQI